ncbi:unnamed protein product, partial [Hapterophycus canaliculatus]
QAVNLAHTLGEYHDQHSGPCSSTTVFGTGTRLRRVISLKVKHIPFPQQLVTCTVEGGEGRKSLRRATVRLPNTATFGELLESARKQRYGALDFEGPVYGRDGELDTTLREAWVRNDCKVDGTLHIGLAVVVSFKPDSRAPLSFIMGPGDTIGGRVSTEQGYALSTLRLKIRGGAQLLEDDVTLEKCCVSGMPVGGISSAGWGELHLEVHVKEFVDNNFRVKLGGISGSGSLDKLVRGVGSNPSFPCSDSKSPHNIPSLDAKVTTCSVGSNPEGHQKSRTGSLTVESTSSSSGLVDDRPSAGNRDDACATVLFVLSPSGTVLTLAMPPAATVLDTKEQVAGFEGISPCRQRILWRGVPMEPDNALLYKVGVRGGDTLIVGYRVSSVSTGTMAPVIELEGTCDDVLLAEEEKDSRTHSCSGGAEHVRNTSNGIAVGQGGDVFAEVTGGGGSNTMSVSEYEEDGDGGTMADRSAGAGALNGGIDLVEDVRRKGEEGEETAEEGTVSPPLLPPPPPRCTAGQGQRKLSGRRAWWSRSKTRIRRGWRDDSSEHGFGNGERRGALGGVLLSYLPSSASSSESTRSSNSNNSSNTRAARVSPAPLRPIHTDPANGIVGGIRSSSTAEIYAPPNVTVREPPLTPSGGRRNLSGWVPWRYGCRLPASPVSTDDGHGGRR